LSLNYQPDGEVLRDNIWMKFGCKLMMLI